MPFSALIWGSFWRKYFKGLGYGLVSSPNPYPVRTLPEVYEL